MSQSRIFLYLCIAFLVGVGVAPLFGSDWRIIGIGCGLLVIIGIISKNATVRTAGGCGIMLLLGIGYAQWLGDNSLIKFGWLEKIGTTLINWRGSLEAINTELLAEPYGSLLNGIIFGGKSQMTKELINAFKITGVTHIIAVSGYNVTIVAAMLMILTQPLPRKISFSVAGAGILIFVLMTGATASVVRAAIMGILVLVAKYIGRRQVSIITLVVAATLMVIIKPSILDKDIGFQLSVAATYGLVMVSPMLLKLVEKITWRKWVPGMIWEALATTMAAQFLTMPIIFYYFGRVSLISPLANILIVPFIPVTMGLGFMTLIGGWLWQPVGQVIAWAGWLFLYEIVFVAEKLANVSWAAVNLPKWVAILIMPYYGLLLIWIYYRKRLPINEKGEIVG